MVVWNPKSKNEFVRGQSDHSISNFSPIFHPRDALSMAKFEHHSFEPCGQIVAFDSSKYAYRRPLYWRYAANSDVSMLQLRVLAATHNVI